MPRWCLCILLFSLPARATGPGCNLFLGIPIGRGVVTVAPRDLRAAGLRVDLDALAWTPAAATEARRALELVNEDTLRAKLSAADSDAQTRAFNLIFERADVALVARDHRVTITSLTRAAFAREDESLPVAVERNLVESAPLTERARAEYARRGAPLAHQLRDVVAKGRLQLVVVNGEETIALDVATGAPDRVTYELAKLLERESALVRLMPARDQRLALKLISAARRALALAWDDPYYRPLSRIRYSEPVANGFENRPVREFIETKRYRHPFWWESFAKFAELMDQAEGLPPGPPAKITAETSRSPLAYLFGRAAERVIYWPAIRQGKVIRPDLTRFRVNETIVDGQVEGVEILVNEREGDEPNGYFFVNMGGDLVPATKFNGNPTGQACARCHAQSREGGPRVFRPFFLRTKEDLLTVGYRGRRIIEGLLGRAVEP